MVSALWLWFDDEYGANRMIAGSVQRAKFWKFF